MFLLMPTNTLSLITQFIEIFRKYLREIFTNKMSEKRNPTVPQ